MVRDCACFEHLVIVGSPPRSTTSLALGSWQWFSFVEKILSQIRYLLVIPDGLLSYQHFSWSVFRDEFVSSDSVFRADQLQQSWLDNSPGPTTPIAKGEISGALGRHLL